MSAYEKANATPEIASEANNGSPSLRHALTSTEMHAIDNTLSEYVSADVSVCISPTVQSSSDCLSRCCRLNSIEWIFVFWNSWLQRASPRDQQGANKLLAFFGNDFVEGLFGGAQSSCSIHVCRVIKIASRVVATS
jgi:hypothetical protein